MCVWWCPEEGKQRGDCWIRCGSKAGFEGPEKFFVIFSLGAWWLLWDILERKGPWEPPTDSPSCPAGREGKEVITLLYLHNLVPFGLPCSFFSSLLFLCWLVWEE